MKTYTIKNYNGNKTLIVNDIASADVKSLYLMARSLAIPFAVKKEIGIQIWGLMTVADYLGIKDCSKLIN